MAPLKKYSFFTTSLYHTSTVSTKKLIMSVDVNIINPFISATINALETMALCKPTRNKVYLKENDILTGDISAVMGVTGDVNGSIILSFTLGAACKAVGNMLGTEYTELNEEVKDGIQEICNLVAGQAKTELSGTKYHFTLGLPTSISGKNHEISHVKGVPCIVAEFDLEGHPFTVEVSIAPNKE